MRIGPTVAVLSGLALIPATTATAGDDEPDVLPRSIYVPVRIETAPCLRDVIVRTEDGEVRAVAPGRLVSQFAFHAGREEPDPAWERLTVEGWIESRPGSGELRSTPFRTRVVITPASIYLGRKRLDLGTLERVGQFRSRVDLRARERTLRFIPPSCETPPAGAPRNDRRPPLPAP